MTKVQGPGGRREPWLNVAKSSYWVFCAEWSVGTNSSATHERDKERMWRVWVWPCQRWTRASSVSLIEVTRGRMVLWSQPFPAMQERSRRRFLNCLGFPGAHSSIKVNTVKEEMKKVKSDIRTELKGPLHEYPNPLLCARHCVRGLKGCRDSSDMVLLRSTAEEQVSEHRYLQEPPARLTSVVCCHMTFHALGFCFPGWPPEPAYCQPLLHPRVS